MQLGPMECARCRQSAPLVIDALPPGWVVVAQASGRRAAVCAGCVTLSEQMALRREALRQELTDLAGPGENVDAHVDALIDRVRRAAIVVTRRRQLGHPQPANEPMAAEVDLVVEVASEAALPLRVVNAIIRGLTT